MHEKQDPEEQNNLGKEEKAEDIMISDFKLLYKIVIKRVWYWHKKQVYRSIEQNRELKYNSQLHDEASIRQGENLQ